MFEGAEEFSAEQNVWTEMMEVRGVWRKLHYEEHISFVHQRTCFHLVNKTNLVHNSFFVCLFLFSTCFGQVCAHHHGLGSSVGISIDYGMDGPGIESRWERDFPRLSRPVLGSTQPPVQWVSGLPWGKVRPGRAPYLSPPSSAEVMEV
jgi:hypothetical protein